MICIRRKEWCSFVWSWIRSAGRILDLVVVGIACGDSIGACIDSKGPTWERESGYDSLLLLLYPQSCSAFPLHCVDLQIALSLLWK